jgi:hypothetical protein
MSDVETIPVKRGRGRPRMSDEDREKSKIAQVLYFKEYMRTHPEFAERKAARNRIYMREQRKLKSGGLPPGRQRKNIQNTDPLQL